MAGPSIPAAKTKKGKVTGFALQSERFKASQDIKEWINDQKRDSDSHPPDAEAAGLIQDALREWFQHREENDVDVPGSKDLKDAKTQAAIKRFKSELKGFAGHLKTQGSQFKAKDIDDTSGVVNWLTLSALDAMEVRLEKVEHDSSVAEEKLAAEAKTYDMPDPGEAKDPWGEQCVFEKEAGNTSMAFGLRMYRALKEWVFDENSGASAPTGYSIFGSPPLETPVFLRGLKDMGWDLKEGGLELGNAWPALPKSHPSIAYDGIASSGTAHWARYNLMGVTFLANGYANCVMVQLAALFVANGSRWVSIRDGGKVRRHSFRNDETDDPYQNNDDPMAEFATRVVGRRGLPGSIGLGCDGATWLGIGKPIPAEMSVARNAKKPYDGRYTADQDVLRNVLIGDWANTSGHHFLIGDVRYAIWFKPADGTNVDHTKPDALCDQSSFVDGGALRQDGDPREYSDDADVPVARVWGESEIAFVEKSESDFKAAVSDFCSGKRKVLGKDVEEIRVWKVGMFTANGTEWKEPTTGPACTAYGKEFRFKLQYPAERASKKTREELAALATPNWEPIGGVPWYNVGVSNKFSQDPEKRPISFVRFHALSPVTAAASPQQP